MSNWNQIERAGKYFVAHAKKRKRKAKSAA
jgi:hypothetical protein